MKKFYLGALSCLLAMGASAQNLNTMYTVDGTYPMGSIAKDFTNTGKGIVYTMEEMEDYATEFKLYDEQFNPTHTFSIKANENYNRKVTERRKAVVTEQYKDHQDYTESYKKWYRTYKSENISFDTDSIAEYVNYRFSKGVDSICVVEGNVIFIVSYYQQDTEGKNYPNGYYMYDGSKLYSVSVSYNSAYTGEWVTEVNHYDDDFTVILGYYDMDASTIAGEGYTGILFGTQSLFNNDNKLEFIREAYEEVLDGEPQELDRDGDGEVDYRQTRYEDRTKAFEIINEDNEVLATIECPANSAYSYPMIFKWGANHYLAIRSQFRGDYIEEYYGYEYTYSWNIYLIEKETNSVRKVNAASLMSVMPVLAERNSTVNVTLDAETVKNGGELIITDSNGRTVGRSYVEAGQTSVPVTTDRMGSGVYNITLTEKGQKVENARIIVK